MFTFSIEPNIIIIIFYTAHNIIMNANTFLLLHEKTTNEETYFNRIFCRQMKLMSTTLSLWLDF